MTSTFHRLLTCAEAQEAWNRATDTEHVQRTLNRAKKWLQPRIASAILQGRRVIWAHTQEPSIEADNIDLTTLVDVARSAGYRAEWSPTIAEIAIWGWAPSVSEDCLFMHDE